MRKKIFDKYSKYYDLIYHDKDYKSEAEYVKNLIYKFSPNAREILEFGSGTGIHGNLLSNKGFNITGVELSQQMVQLSNQSKKFKCINGDIREIKIGCLFDVVISLFHVVSYQTKNSDLKLVFANAHHHLKEKGLFIFDFWYAPAVLSQYPEPRLKKFKNKNQEIVRFAKPKVFENKNIVDVNYEIFINNLQEQTYETFCETHSMRYFSIPELDILAESQGFKRIGEEEFLTGNPPSKKTWGVCLIYQKI